LSDFSIPTVYISYKPYLQDKSMNTLLAAAADAFNQPVFALYYVIALAFGGSFLVFSVFAGGDDADADADMDMDADFDAGDMDVELDAGDLDADMDAELQFHPDHVHDLGDGQHGQGTPSGGLVWFPFISIRFWVFFLTFGGMAGLLFEFLGGVTGLMSPVIAIATGYICGTTAVNVLRWARRSDVSTSMNQSEMVGMEAKVILPIEPNELGKIRIATRSGSEDMSAICQDGTVSLGVNADVIIHGFDQHRAIVKPKTA
jgi:hypothetical protein